MPQKMLVTYALPYANGSLHLGHLVGMIQTDIWVRFQKMRPETHCLFICGCDGHGTPIMIQAEKLHIPPEQLIAEVKENQEKDLKDFYIDLDNYYTTHSPENQALVEIFYARHLKKGNINKHTIKQAFDPEKNMFLPDRYIKGECPRCGAKDQYGDSCEVCGATYAPTELKNPYSTLSGAKPIEKESEHYFFKLQNYTDLLKKWMHKKTLQSQVIHKLDEWFDIGLREWDISRDAPYFGFKIPGEENKYFYVWLDAPMGYIASFQNLQKRHPDLHFDDYWGKDSKIDLYQFIGKDIMYFHTLFWPALLQGADFRMPTAIFCHGFMTVDGQKMSKSRGTFIKARTYLNHLNPEYLRYYLATKLNERIEDLDISFDDFMQRVNADLVGKFINIASRSASFIHKYFDNQLSKTLAEPALFKTFVDKGGAISEKYQNREFSQAIREIMGLADLANQYVDTKKPWASIKDPQNKAEVHDVCTMALNLFRVLTIYLKPVLPDTAKKIEAFLNIPALSFEDRHQPLLDHTIQIFTPLLKRLEKSDIESLKNEALQHE
jgi:methionyl-tRNA synthetase